MQTISQQAGADAQLPGMEDEEEVFVFPLSFAQQRLWFVDQMDPGNPLYNVPTVLLLEGALDPDALARALGEIVGRHEVLRTVFDVEDGEPVQVVLPWRPLELPLMDLGGRTEEERQAELDRRAAAEARRAFDLAAGPLFHAELLRLAPEEHVLFLTMHHIVSDAWSIGVLLRELGALYDAFARGEESPLDDLPIQYADFAVWQRERLSGERLEAQLAYWRDQLRDPPVLDLPTDRPRPPAPSFHGGNVGVQVSAATSAALRDLARAEGATLFMPLLAAWQALLARHAGQDNVVAGTPIANRNRSEIEGLIGFFVNTLALRADLSGDPTFRELLRQVRERTFGAYAHQDLPFEKIVEELAPERDLSRSPVFQVMFSLQNAPVAEAPADAGLRIGLYGGRMESAKYDLILTLVETPDDIRGALSYATDLFDRTTAERIASHYAALLDGIAADPDLRVADLPLMDAAERRRVLEEWNATARPYDLARPVHERISEQARRTPDAPAVLSPAGTLTFAELERRADDLAVRLRARGVGVDGRVGLLLERSAGTVVAVLGILKAGAAYVALDPSYPDDRLRFMLADAGASVVVTSAELAGRLDGFAGGIVLAAPSPPGPLSPASGRKGEHDKGEGQEALPQNWGRVASLSEPGGGDPADASVVPVHPDHLAYVIYTSGSTGTPKGVLVTHRGLSNYLAWFDEAVLGADGFVLPLVSRLSFDAHVRQLFPPLLRGEPVLVLPEATVTDPAALLDAISTHERASFGGVPSLWSAMLELVRSGEAAKPAGLRAVLLGGEALSPELAERTFAAFPDVALWNHYGPTEATVNTSVARVRPGEPVGIGRPVGNVRVYLLDARGAPVPVGVPGELYVGGAGVSRGYLGRPGLTAERFVPDPFSGEPGARMYRSGDRVRWRADGELDYVGRVDQQVKVRGFRIEPGEIEAVLERHPGVRAAAVAVREDTPGAPRLVGYVVPEGGAVPSVSELRLHLAERLPEYMVPGALVLLERLPLSPNGKVDRRGLPAPEASADDAYTAPRTPAEEILAGIWAEVLKLEHVGAHDNFFEVGGHSLLATRVVSRIRQAFGVEVPLRAVFEAPTLAGLAERVEAALRAGAGVQAPPIRPVPRDRPLPASFAQQRLWFIQQMEPASSAYNMPYALRLRGALDVDAMGRALDALRERHESLRTVFAFEDRVPVQVVEPAGPRPLPVEDLGGLPEELRLAAAAERARAEAATPFDLARGPLLRAGLLRLADDDWVLLLTLHHIVTDGWSTGILVGELSAFYTAFARGGEARLPALPVQYPDFAAWQRGWLAGDTLELQLAYWRERLAGAPPLLEIPTDRPRPPAQSPRGAQRGFAVSEATTAAVRELSRREGATLFMTLVAAWQALLGRWSGMDDVLVGTPIAGRNRVETEGLIGFFVNTLVLRADLGDDPGLRALLAQVRESTLGAYAHQDIPFEKLVEELAPERSLQHTPLFQVLFVLQNNERGALELGGLATEPLEGEGETTHFDLGLAMAEAGERLVGGASYRTELFDADTIDRMLGHYLALLEGAAAEPDRPLSDLPLLAAPEREQLLGAWGAAAPAPPAPLPVHRAFASMVAATPGAAAVVDGSDVIPYAELERRANRLANALVGLGVRSEDRVGVLLPPGADMVAALLGVLASGGACVPLDPALPPERLAFLAADAGLRAVLTRDELRGRLPDAGAAVLSLDGDAARIAAAGDGAPGVDAALGSLAYVIYTSGSTGRPKGVGVEHGALAAHLAGMAAALGIVPADRVLHFAAPGFDVSLEQVLLPLTHGAALVARGAQPWTPADWAERVGERGVTVANLPPAYWQEVAAAGGALPALRLLVVGADAMPAATVARWREAVATPARLLNAYGPTEAVVTATLHALPEDGTGSPGAVVPIGRPLPGRAAYVLDRAAGLVPAGAPGELCLGGPLLARGYVGRPELTAGRFVPDPFTGEPGARMYRTGDRVRWLRAGDLEFMGRVDQQVKVRGFRIEPGETEAALRLHPGVADAVVAARADGGEQRLVGYVVPAGAMPADGELRAFLRERLPDYMVPTAWVALERLPLTSNGKLDRRALPAPAAGGAGEGSVAPRTPTEARLAAIWEEVLRRSPVGVHDNFFDLGGHSLLVMQVVARVRTTFGVDLPIPRVFEKPTVAELAAVLDGGQAAPRRTGPIRRADRSGRTLGGPG